MEIEGWFTTDEGVHVPIIKGMSKMESMKIFAEAQRRRNIKYKYPINTWQGQFERSGVYENARFQAEIAAENKAKGLAKTMHVEIYESDGEYGAKIVDYTKEGYENRDDYGERFSSKEKLIKSFPTYLKNLEIREREW